MRLSSAVMSMADKLPGGRGGRLNNNRPPPGLTIASLKQHFALTPLFALMGVGMTFVAAYLVRLATKSTDVSWRKETEPFNGYKNKQFKFFNPNNVDYSKVGNEIPDYRNMK